MSEHITQATFERVYEMLKHPLAASQHEAAAPDLIDRALAAFYYDDEPEEDRGKGMYAERLRVKMIRACLAIFEEIRDAE